MPLLRLIKLYKLINQDGLATRWQVRHGLPFSAMLLVFCAIMILLAIHWLSCFWYMCTMFDSSGEDSITWVEAFVYSALGHFVNQDAIRGPLYKYQLAIYHG